MTARRPPFLETSCVGTMRAPMPMLAIKVVPPKSTRIERAPSLMRRKAYSRKDSAAEWSSRPDTRMTRICPSLRSEICTWQDNQA